MTKSETSTYPVVFSHEQVVMPATVASVEVSDTPSLRAVDAAIAGDGELFVVMLSNPEAEEPGFEDVVDVGVLAEITDLRKHSARRYTVMLRVGERFQVEDLYQSGDHSLAQIATVAAVVPDEGEESLQLVGSLRRMLADILADGAEDPETIRDSLDEVDDPDDLVDLAAAQLELADDDKLALLTEIDILERVRLVLPALGHKHEVVLRKAEIHDEVVDETARSTREMLLRDRMRAIREELGESDETEVEELRTKILDSKMPDVARQAALKQLRRMGDMSPSSAEYNIASTYVNWLIDIPFGRVDKDTIDVQGARAVLDNDHSGLDKVKKRIVEFIAVRKLAPDKRGPILCFVGPPGVGKTSLARSIATALGREYVRISLGGVRDDAEIRGHRRTYVGALPGRIISGLKKAGSINPVFVLDEIDKLAASSRGGDPSSAMLEVLDPEQNKEFVDHYIEVPVDVSKVMFIATANGLDNIPAPLLDRIEVIEITGYSEREKYEIARDHLLGKQLAEHGLEDDQLIMTDEAIDSVIDGYTREAGVRNLERELANVCRYAAVSIADGAESPIHMGVADLEKVLGPRKYIHEAASRHPEVGVVTGLSWTPVGGKVLFLEARTMPGKGKIRVTGQLGDVMMESAQTALSWVKSNSSRLGIDLTILEKLDLHIHAPEGAVRKDGPSAGVGMAIALTSVFTGKPARAKVAVTGEITLRGRVLPVGGIKSKLLAAHRAGVKTVLIPERNLKDLPEVPESVLADLEVVPISRVEEAIERALAGDDDEPTTVPPTLGDGSDESSVVARS